MKINRKMPGFIADRRSPDFIVAASFDIAADEIAAIREISDPFGDSPPPGMLALPLNKSQWLVARFDGPKLAGRLLNRRLYEAIHNPFAILDRFPINPDSRDPIVDAEWPDEPLTKRTVEVLRPVLQQGDAPLLLGAAQILVDGGFIALPHSPTCELLFRDIFAIIPDGTCGEISLATVPGTAPIPARLIAVPPGVTIPGYANEEQVRDCPAGYYEANLQLAIEGGEEASLAQLLARRTPRQTIRLALGLIIGLGLVSLALRILNR